MLQGPCLLETSCSHQPPCRLLHLMIWPWDREAGKHHQTSMDVFLQEEGAQERAFLDAPRAARL